MKSGLFRIKPIQTILSEISDNEHGFKRTLTATSLTTLGIGSVIGAGIFVLTGQAAAQYAGPAIVFSFIIAGLACTLAGLCYAEFASMIPISGSAYTYAYATLGELLAWIIGWDLVLQYLFAASSVAVGWSDYVMSFLLDFGITIPPQFTGAWHTVLVEVPNMGWKPLNENLINDLSLSGLSIDSLPHITTICNLPAMFIVAFFTILLVIGIKESASFNNLMVVIKVSLIILFIGLGFMFVKAGNWMERDIEGSRSYFFRICRF
jgi:APA family basic amino acid/polyamine antiporter